MTTHTAASAARPALGLSGSVLFDDTDKTAPLQAGTCYVLTSTAECFIALDGAATTAANQVHLPAATPLTITTSDASGSILHVTQSFIAGTLYYSARVAS